MKRGSSLSPKNLALLACVALSFCLAGKLGLRVVAFVHPSVTPIWIPSGIAVAAFVLFGYRVWPAILIGDFLDHVTTDGFELASFLIPIAATLEAFTAAYFVNRFAHGRKAFDTARDVFRFVLFACVCAPSISATLGASLEHLRGNLGGIDLGSRWLTWWLAYGVGTLLVAPFFILLFRASHHRMNGREFGELTVLLLGLIFACLLVFGPLSLSLNKNQVVQVWVCVPFLIWAAFRFCPLEAAGTTLILFGSAIGGTLYGYGSFIAKNLTTSLILLDTFIGVIGTMTLVVAAMVVERRNIECELLGTQSLLQKTVEKKEQDLAVTVRALEVEMTGHVQTKRALRESDDLLRRIGPTTEPAE
jgi:integral membrane sensor domain MASE1